jgi:predicted DNA-binding ribbon-helix-helix protein
MLMQMAGRKEQQVRRSVTLPRAVATQVARMAKQRRLSDNRLLVELIEQGIAARKEKEKTFFSLAERFRAATDPEEVKQLGDRLSRFVFGD